MNPPILSVIIVSYNVRDLLQKCLLSIMKSFEEVDIIVVDNNSSDDTDEMIEHYFPSVKFIANKINQGFSAANNQGLSQAKGRFIMLLNPDTILKNGALNKLLIFTSKNDKYLVAPRLLNADGSIQISCWKFSQLGEIIAELFYLHRLLGIREYPREKFNLTSEVDACSGAAMMFRREFWNDVGVFDENLFWMDDVDLCFRAKQKGYRIIYFPEAEIIHYSGQSTKKNIRIALSNQLISKMKFARKHYGFVIFLFTSLIIFLQIISRFFILAAFSVFKKKFRLHSLAYLYSLKRFMLYIFAGDQNIF